ncbi:MAG TPA: DUF1684 domain-containing protein [Brevibacterium senegalense]|uniref:DUF1684 domain-containing protein n=1 Tax=Brevibacterium senegalense TaxID=1033736 RepID=A0A921ME98_9MICO|nr:DUF1684 domain-containing protein [Brevibacterium senegalense]
MEQFTSEWQAWHDERLAALATPFGMLSITGLHWLQQGENTWEGAPGRFDLDGDTITFRIGAGHSAGPTRAALEAAAQQETQTASAVELGSTADGASWIRLPRDGGLTWLVSDHTAYEAIDRDGRIGIRVHDSKSALLAHFVDIPAFPVTEAAVVSGRFEPYPAPRVRRIATALPGLEMDRTTVGTVTFALGGRTHTLIAAGSPETGLVLDFHDTTNGDTTPSWRTLSVGLPAADGSVTLDFNRTVIYPFAFHPWATCPAPVEENILRLPVRAGEKTPTRTLTEEGLTHPVGVVALSDAFDGPEVFRWIEESGAQLFGHRVRRGTQMPGPASASAFIVYGMRDAQDHADAASEAAVREFADDALAVGTPLVGVGSSGAQIVFEAARHLQRTTHGVDDGQTAPEAGGTGAGASGAAAAGARDSGAGDSADDPGLRILQESPLPVVVSADFAHDRLLRGSVTICPDSALGFVDIEGLAAQVGDDTPTRSRVWNDLIDRFTRLVVTSG